MSVISLPEITGFVGVSILLAAFFLNLAGYMPSNSNRYLVLNFVGAALAGFSSWLIGFMPFVLLEGTWAVVAAGTPTKQLLIARNEKAHSRE